MVDTSDRSIRSWANTVRMADDSSAGSHSITPSRTRSRPTYASSGSRIWNPRTPYFQEIGRWEDWGPNDWDRDSHAGYDDDDDDDDDDNGNDDDNTVKMSTWAGQPKVEGSSETMRMMLLTCVSIGITSVHVHCAGLRNTVLLTCRLQLHLGR
jgi:hypothetical protein